MQFDAGRHVWRGGPSRLRPRLVEVARARASPVRQRTLPERSRQERRAAAANLVFVPLTFRWRSGRRRPVALPSRHALGVLVVLPPEQTTPPEFEKEHRPVVVHVCSLRRRRARNRALAGRCGCSMGAHSRGCPRSGIWMPSSTKRSAKAVASSRPRWVTWRCRPRCCWSEHRRPGVLARKRELEVGVCHLEHHRVVATVQLVDAVSQQRSDRSLVHRVASQSSERTLERSL